jgi:citronellol/citronellal dehydrogenase
MQDVNTRGTFMLTRACLPHLAESSNAHVLTLSPPLNLDPSWLGRHPGYMLAKYGMTLATLGFAAEFAARGIAANCLWPRTTIATDAVANLLGGDAALARTRRPEIVADAAYAILTRPADDATGRTFIDDEVLAEQGTTDLARYSSQSGATEFDADVFL